MPLKISTKIRNKLSGKIPPVTEDEILQCFANRWGLFLRDTRERHDTDPPTLWFIAETNKRRLLKVCFIKCDEDIHIRTAYDPNPVEVALYESKHR